jgi:hypothetical protein
MIFGDDRNSSTLSCGLGKFIALQKHFWPMSDFLSTVFEWLPKCRGELLFEARGERILIGRQTTELVWTSDFSVHVEHPSESPESWIGTIETVPPAAVT